MQKTVSPIAAAVAIVAALAVIVAIWVFTGRGSERSSGGPAHAPRLPAHIPPPTRGGPGGVPTPGR